MSRARRSVGLQFLHDRFIGDDPAKIDAFEVAKSNAEVALAIYQLRVKARMTQTELARIVGTTPSVISRLEDADYDGHSLSMLKRIAAALGRRVVIRFALADRGAKTKSPITSIPASFLPGGGGRKAFVVSKAGKAVASAPKAVSAKTECAKGGKKH